MDERKEICGEDFPHDFGPQKISVDATQSAQTVVIGRQCRFCGQIRLDFDDSKREETK